jgi:hypothetical protein
MNRTVLLAPLALLAACSTSATVPMMEPAAVTFHKDIEPLLQQHCLICHSDGNIAPFPLLTYDEARVRAPTMAAQTAAHTMPPWGARTTSECQPPFSWKGDIQLSDDEIALFQSWSEAGAPEGDPADAPPPWQAKSYDLSNVSATLMPAQPFATSGSQDQFRCFPLDLPISQLEYINGVFFKPGNSAVVHHAVLFTDPTGASSALAGSAGSYDCFGGAGVPNPGVLGVWAPGGTPIELPSNIGMPVAPGTKLVMQIHYHPAGSNGESDQTAVELRYTTARPDYILITSGVGNYPGALPGGDGLQPDPDDRTSSPEFRIPAMSTHHTETMVFTMPSTINGAPVPQIWIYGMMAHMHLAGVDEKITSTKPSGAQTCLMQEPQWNFGWQRFYAYDAPVDQLPELQPGDKIQVRCTYDNSPSNQQLFSAWAEAGVTPKDIYLGEQTFDEMCLVLPQLLVKNPL